MFLPAYLLPRISTKKKYLFGLVLSVDSKQKKRLQNGCFYKDQPLFVKLEIEILYMK